VHTSYAATELSHASDLDDGSSCHVNRSLLG